MFDTIEKPNLQDELGLAQLAGAAIFLAGLAFVLLTGNAGASFFFLVAAVAVINIDYYVKKQTAARPTVSLLDAPQNPRARVRYGLLFWIGLGLMLAVFLFTPHVRIYASLMISAFCVWLYNRYKSARS
jgi:drug/metabolite transporter (DMT)-like permease